MQPIARPRVVRHYDTVVRSSPNSPSRPRLSLASSPSPAPRPSTPFCTARASWTFSWTSCDQLPLARSEIHELCVLCELSKPSVHRRVPFLRPSCSASSPARRRPELPPSRDGGEGRGQAPAWPGAEPFPHPSARKPVQRRDRKGKGEIRPSREETSRSVELTNRRKRERECLHVIDNKRTAHGSPETFLCFIR